MDITGLSRNMEPDPEEMQPGFQRPKPEPYVVGEAGIKMMKKMFWIQTQVNPELGKLFPYYSHCCKVRQQIKIPNSPAISNSHGIQLVQYPTDCFLFDVDDFVVIDPWSGVPMLSGHEQNKEEIYDEVGRRLAAMWSKDDETPQRRENYYSCPTQSGAE